MRFLRALVFYYITDCLPFSLTLFLSNDIIKMAYYNRKTIYTVRHVLSRFLSKIDWFDCYHKFLQMSKTDLDENTLIGLNA